MEVLPVEVPGPRGPVNCYVVRSGGEALVVDAGPDPEARPLLAALDRLGARPGALVLTHIHRGHLRGAAAVLETTGAELCTSATEGFLLEHWESLARPAPRRPPAGPHGPPGRMAPPRAEESGRAEPPDPSFRPPEPGRLLRDGDLLRVGEEELAVHFTPGHSVGHICLGGPGVLFSGDLLPGTGMPYLGPVRGEVTGDPVAFSFFASLAKVSALGDRTLYPGHGPPGGRLRPRLAEVAGIFEGWEATLKSALRKERRGKSAPELAASAGVPDVDPAVRVGNTIALLEKLRIARRIQRRGDLYFGPRA